MNRLFRELQRRKVFRVAGAYIVASWVLLQVTDFLVPVLSLPDWTTRLVLLLLVVGFVPAVIIAWAYEMTPQGIKRDDEAAFITRDEMDSPPRRGVIIAAFVMLVIIAAAAFWFLGSDERWARNEAIPRIEAFADAGDWEAAYRLALRAAEVLADDSELEDLWGRFSTVTSIRSEPAGATVYRRPYAETDANWRELGKTPLNDIRTPYGFSELRIERDGYEPLIRVVGTEVYGIARLDAQDRAPNHYAIVFPELFRLDSVANFPEGYVRVSGWDQAFDDNSISFNDYYIGRYEVTNEEFSEFVDAGGYSRREFWEHAFISEGVEIGWEEAMARFVDRSGRPGPSTWVAGRYPDGQGDFPVTGVSWYEAAAYARYAGRELPSVHHWRRAFSMAMLPATLPRSNLQSDQLSPVGQYAGIGWTGAHDMLGNAREWCFNEMDGNRVLIGGSYEDLNYVAQESIQDPGRAPPFDRSPTNGFRLAFTADPGNVKALATAAIDLPDPPVAPEPANDAVFEVYRSAFDYDPGPLNDRVESVSPENGWTHEKITFDAPYGDSRVILELYVPNDSSPATQVVLFWPGSGAMYFDSSGTDVTRLLGFILKNGRAVAFPVYAGTFQRRLPEVPSWNTVAGRELTIRQVKDLRRTVDYLETRPDIDRNSIAYYGLSWGGRLGGIVLAVEPRIKVGILDQAGINFDIRPEIDVTNFLPHISQPVLQFNGRYDSDFVYETSARPFYELIGTREPDKRHVVEPTSHYVSRPTVIGETLDWLDKYLGPVNR